MEATYQILTKKHIKHHSKRPIRIPKLNTYFSKKLSLKDDFRWGGGYYVPELYETPKKIGVLLDASSSSTLKSFYQLPIPKLVDCILNPGSISQFRTNFVENDCHGVIKPFNLPDMSDLALTPKAIKLFFIWLLKNASHQNIGKVLEVVMAGTAAQLPVVREEYDMRNGVHDVIIRSYSNYFKIVYLYSEFTDIANIDATIQQLTNDVRDGRELNLHFEAHRRVQTDAPNRKRVKISNLHAHIRLIVWNCRGIARSAFPAILAHIIELHNPEFMILSETRVFNFICNTILQNKGLKVFGANPKLLGGGIAVVALSKAIQVHVLEVDENKWSGWVQLN